MDICEQVAIEDVSGTPVKPKSSVHCSGPAANTHFLAMKPAPNCHILGSANQVHLGADKIVCVDSGATHHMTPHKDDFEAASCTPMDDCFVNLADSAPTPVLGVGTVVLNKGGHFVRECDWHHVPALSVRLHSVSVHRRKPDCCFKADDTECTLGCPTFTIPIDDSAECATSCKSAVGKKVLDCDEASNEIPARATGLALRGVCKQSPSPGMPNSSEVDPAVFNTESSREVPPQHVVESAAAKTRGSLTTN